MESAAATTPRRFQRSAAASGLDLRPWLRQPLSASVRASFFARRISTDALVPECPPEQFLVLTKRKSILRPSRSITADLHTHARADGIANACALTTQLLSGLVELEVFATQLV